jgi:hypothetical protein
MTPVEPPEDRDWGGDHQRRKQRLPIYDFDVTLEYAIGSSPQWLFFVQRFRLCSSDADDVWKTLTCL